MTHNKDRALEVIEFISMLNLVDDFYGQPFVLLDWQHKVLWDVYGTVENDRRQYRYAYLEIPKKNGKSTLIAAIALYHLVCDPKGGQIFCCASDRQQAEIIYKAACGMREQNPDLEEILKLTDSKKEIKNTITGTTFKVLSAEAYTKHGLNPTVVIFDELHAQPNRNLWDVMTFGAGAARKEPLWWVITTAGDDPDRHSIGWEIHDKAKRIMDGESDNQAWYVKIYGAPEDANIFEESTWYAANPSLGSAISIESVRQEATDARDSEGAEKLFRWLRLNQWVSLKRVGWLPLTLWDTTEGKWNPAELIGKRCYAGLDLSSTTDLTALKLLFPPQDGLEGWREISEAWIPEDSMKERVARDGVPYDRWVKSKHLHVTPGNVVDYEFVEARILAFNQQYDLQMLGTDQWNARMLAQRLEKSGVKLYEVPQDIRNLSPAMKEQERLMKTGMYTHEHNPVARWCFGNTNIAIDGNGNIKPMKNKSVERIDIAVAGVIAMAVAIQMGATMEKCPYSESRGILML